MTKQNIIAISNKKQLRNCKSRRAGFHKRLVDFAKQSLNLFVSLALLFSPPFSSAFWAEMNIKESATSADL